MARELRASRQARRPAIWSSIRPEALVPAERDLGTGTVLLHADAPDQHSKDRHDERHESPRHRGQRVRASGPRRSGRRLQVMVIGVAAGVLVLAGGGVAFARHRQHPPGAQALASIPAGGSASTPAAGAVSGVPSPTPSPTSLVSADPRVFRGTMVARVSAFETQPDSVHRYQGDARVSCDAGTCSVAIPGSPWLLAGATISAGDGSPGTYRTSHPAAGKAARCASFRIQDAFESTLTISAHKLTYRATAPGWPMTQCTSTHSVGRAPGTWTFTGILVE